MTKGQVYSKILEKAGATVFTGYNKLESTAKVVAIIKEGSLVEKALENEEGEVVLD